MTQPRVYGGAQKSFFEEKHDASGEQMIEGRTALHPQKKMLASFFTRFLVHFTVHFRRTRFIHN